MSDSDVDPMDWDIDEGPNYEYLDLVAGGPSTEELEFLRDQLNLIDAKAGFESHATKTCKVKDHSRFSEPADLNNSENEKLDDQVNNEYIPTSPSSIVDDSDLDDDVPHKHSTLGSYPPKKTKRYLSCECEICGNPKLVNKRVGISCCNNCQKAIGRAKIGKKKVLCFGRGNCLVQWKGENSRKGICFACRLRKIINHPNFKPISDSDKTLLSIHISIAAQDFTINSTCEQSRHEGQYCAICEKPEVKTKKYGIASCSNCSHFIRNTIENDTNHECIDRGDCPLKYIEGNKRGLCGFCRWRKIVENKSFRRKPIINIKFEDLGTSSSGSDDSSDQDDYNDQSHVHKKPSDKTRYPGGKCVICENPNYVERCSYGPIFCMNCRYFTRYTLFRDNRPKCLAGGKCLIKWKENVKQIACGACRWAKIIQHPEFRRDLLDDCFRNRDTDTSSSDEDSD